MAALAAAWQECTDFSQCIAEADQSQRAELDERLRKLLRTWFDRKLVVVENYEATGEQIMHTICEETPPGYRNRIMGLQNIKGTGLDFVYRWQAWDACYSACELLVCGDAPTAERIARHRAVAELRALNRRQKGGWLAPSG